VEPHIYLNGLLVIKFSKWLSPIRHWKFESLESIRVIKKSISIPTTISSLKDIANLLTDNQLIEGSIPESFGALVSLEFLDISCNNLSREIPMSFKALSHLKYLNVSFNRLQGKVPVGGPFVHFFAASFMSNDGLCGALQLQVLLCKEGVSQ
jgi:LRR receptor-like serine/threonine-protein kinase FLS2